MAVGTFHSWQEPPGIVVAAGVPEHFVVALLPKDPEQPEGQEPPGIAAAAAAVAPVPEQGRRRTDQRYLQMPSTPWPGEERELEHPTATPLVVVVPAVAVGAPQFQRMDWRVESPLPIAAAAAAEAAVHIAAAGAVAAAAAGTGVADTAAGAVADADADTAVLDCRQEAWQS